MGQLVLIPEVSLFSSMDFPSNPSTHPIAVLNRLLTLLMSIDQVVRIDPSQKIDPFQQIDPFQMIRFHFRSILMNKLLILDEMLF